MVDGIEMWCKRIITGEWTPGNVAAHGFFHSDEFAGILAGFGLN